MLIASDASMKGCRLSVEDTKQGVNGQISKQENISMSLYSNWLHQSLLQ